MQQPLTIFNSKCKSVKAQRSAVQDWGGNLVHYSQGVRISNFQRFFTKPPTPLCISSTYLCLLLFIICALSVGEKIGNWVLDFCPHKPAFPNFAGNGNFHILAEIENIKSGSGCEYQLYMHQRLREYCNSENLPKVGFANFGSILI